MRIHSSRIKRNKAMKQLNFTFELTQEEYDLLLHIAKEGYAEYRDPEFETLKDWDSSIRNEGFKDEYFLDRNTNGTYHLTQRLYELRLIQVVDMAWHTTYELSEFGKLVLIANEIDYKNI